MSTKLQLPEDPGKLEALFALCITAGATSIDPDIAAFWQSLRALVAEAMDQESLDTAEETALAWLVSHRDTVQRVGESLRARLEHLPPDEGDEPRKA